jgi:hypothetical protein
LATKTRIPSNHLQEEYANVGGLVSYGPSYTALFRRAPTYIDKILKGAKPADRAADQIRTRDQLEDRQADRIDHSAERFGPSGQRHQMIEQSKIQNDHDSAERADPCVQQDPVNAPSSPARSKQK